MYIGSTGRFSRRKTEHLRLLKQNKHHSRHLQYAYNLYGLESFKFDILVDNILPEDVFTIENEYISRLNPQYNMMKNVFSHIGLKRSKETCKKISDSLKGNIISEEAKEKIRQHNLGKIYSEETKLKHSISSTKMWEKKNTYPIEAYYKNGTFYKEFGSVTEAAIELNCKRSGILAILNNYDKQRKSYKGYKWKKVNIEHQ